MRIERPKVGLDESSNPVNLGFNPGDAATLLTHLLDNLVSALELSERRLFSLREAVGIPGVTRRSLARVSLARQLSVNRRISAAGREDHRRHAQRRPRRSQHIRKAFLIP